MMKSKVNKNSLPRLGSITLFKGKNQMRAGVLFDKCLLLLQYLHIQYHGHR